MSDSDSNVNINQETSDDKSSRSFIAIFISTFVSVFIAELGDKTQIATLILSAESGKPLIVFIGAATALICSSLVVVVLGRWLSNSVSQTRINFLTGLLMLTIGIWFGVQATQSFFFTS
tara:strand:+ start:14121 stop:14477 length:357 start_codon:yes stop_codon:yes gene_type:complete